MWIGDVLADRFVMERPIGSGGMGVVFRARDRRTGDAVAVKILDAKEEGDVLERFNREAGLLEQLSHPAIVRHIAHGQAPNGPFLAMELLEGEDLATHLLRARPSLDDALAIVTRAAEALSVAHAIGVVHRDVKPANLFLVGRDPRRLKVLDFGIASARGRAPVLTQSGTMLGTVGYMAPEQVTSARDVDARADVFALGCVLFQCLTGKVAFSGPNAVVMVTKTLFVDPPRVSELSPELGDAYDELVARLLHKDPERRPKDAAAVLEELRAVVGVPSTQLASGRHAEGAPTAHGFSSVILALPELGAVESSETVSPEDAGREEARVSTLARRFRAQIRRLAGGGLMLELDGDSGEDVARRASECALQLSMMAPALGIAVATGGRAEPLGMGAIIERADEVMRRRALVLPRGPLIDARTAEHVPGARRVADDDDVHELLSPGDPRPAPTGPREPTLNVVSEDRIRLRSQALQAFLARPRDKRKLGPFFLERPLGKGGFAPVWLATEVYDGIELRQAAVKLFAFDGVAARENETRYREHVVREARALCQVEHPNIVRFYSLLIDDGAEVVGLAMEYLVGSSLADRLRAAGPLSVEETLRVAATVTSALEAAHAAGIVHRDVKPANVMESPAGYKLIDFGIATDDEREASAPASAEKRTLPDELPLDLAGTRMTMVLDPGDQDAERTAPLGILASGTVGYIDPECVATGAEATAASDLYSLGALLFECLSGTLPAIAGGARPGLSGAVLDGRARAPSIAEIAPATPRPLAELVDGLLAPERAVRPQTASDVARALRAVARREEPPAGETSAHEPAPLAPTPSRARGPLLALLAVGGAALAAVALRSPSGARGEEGRVSASAGPSRVTEAPPASPPPPPRPAPVPTPRESRIQVHPQTVAVTVDGHPAKRSPDGAVLVTGEPGTTFALVLREGGRSQSARVVLLRDGRTEPEHLEMSVVQRAPTRSPVPGAAGVAPAPSMEPAAPPKPALVPGDEF